MVILGHVMLIASLGLMLVTGNTDGAALLPFGSEENGVSAALIWGGVDVVVAVGLTFFYRRAQLPPSDLFASTSEKLTKHEGYLRFGLGVMAVVFAGFIVAYLVDGVNGNGQFPFVANSVTKDGLFLAITLLAISNLRRFGWMTLLVIMGHLMLIVSLLLMLATGNTAGADLLPGGSEEHGVRTLLIWAGADVLVVTVLSILLWRAERARYGLKYLWPYEFATIEALSDVLIDDDHRVLPPAQIAGNVDGYLGDFKATGKIEGQARDRVLDHLSVPPPSPPDDGTVRAARVRAAALRAGERKRFHQRRSARCVKGRLVAILRSTHDQRGGATCVLRLLRRHGRGQVDRLHALRGSKRREEATTQPLTRSSQSGPTAG